LYSICLTFRVSSVLSAQAADASVNIHNNGNYLNGEQRAANAASGRS
jgi:hypothetical protein